MNFWKILWMPVARRKVDDAIIADFEGILEAKLRRRGLLIDTSRFDGLLKRLVQEAYFRAAANESDGVPRYGRMSEEVDAVAHKTALIWSGKNEVDSAISRILVHHGLIRVP